MKNHFASEAKGVTPCRYPSWQTAIVLFSLLFAFAFSSQAQSGPTEYQVKAAFVYNFAKFVDWPQSAFTNASSPYVIGVLGDNPFGDGLEKMIAGKKINGRDLVFKTFASARDIDNCQILFVSKSERHHFAEIFGILHGRSILTVGETDNFISDGGIINFILMPDRTIRFQINNQAAKTVSLKISSDLLDLAQ